MTFNELGVVPSILKALSQKGYTNPTPIQEQSIPLLLRGFDLLGCAQTGTGKTASFAIPILQMLLKDREDYRGPRKVEALIVAPTRELAIQIGDSFREYGRYTKLRHTTIFGGVKAGPQIQALQRGIDILIATPGRLLDLMQQGYISLADISYFVLDEADHMLDMGFIHDIRRLIAKLPDDRQSLFFSATMPKEIRSLADTILFEPETVTIKPQQATAERVDQSVYFVGKKDKPKLLQHLLKTDEAIESLLVFSRTKYGADKLVRKLKQAKIEAAAIHGNKSQGARQRVLGQFKKGEINVLVATDIAARGIDVSELSHVINYDLPNVPETYVHRIGRTGRAAASGIAISFCDTEEKSNLRAIQRLIKQELTVVTDHPYPDDGPAEVLTEKAPGRKSNNQHSSGRGNKNNRWRGGRNRNRNNRRGGNSPSPRDN